MNRDDQVAKLLETIKAVLEKINNDDAAEEPIVPPAEAEPANRPEWIKNLIVDERTKNLLAAASGACDYLNDYGDSRASDRVWEPLSDALRAFWSPTESVEPIVQSDRPIQSRYRLEFPGNTSRRQPRTGTVFRGSGSKTWVFTDDKFPYREVTELRVAEITEFSSDRIAISGLEFLRFESAISRNSYAMSTWHLTPIAPKETV